MLVIKDLFVNMFFIIFTLFLNQLFIFDKPMKNKTKRNITFIGGMLQIILVMTFPINIHHYFIDLRQVPFIIGYLYNGYRIGFGLYFIIILYQYILDGGNFISTIYINSLLFLFLFLLSTKFKGYNIIKKQVVLVGISSISSILLLSSEFFFSDFKTNFLYLPVLLFFFQSFVLLLETFFIEKIKTNVMLRENIKQKEKLEVVSRLAASISHEVRNPLTVSRGFLQYLDSYDVSMEKKKEFMQLALKEIDRANDIVSNYLIFAKPVLETLEKIEITQSINKIIDLFSPCHKMRKINISLHAKGDYYVLGDKDKFEQCLINLMRNSKDAMPDGGTQTIYLSSMNNTVIINISDSGIGMSPEEIRRLGEPYFSTKEKGTGLGMMVVFSIIKAMKGTITIKSEKGKGTQVIIKLPIHNS